MLELFRFQAPVNFCALQCFLNFLFFFFFFVVLGTPPTNLSNNVVAVVVVVVVARFNREKEKTDKI